MIGQAFANWLFIAAVYRVGTEDLGGAVPAPVTFCVRAAGGCAATVHLQRGAAVWQHVCFLSAWEELAVLLLW